MGADRVAPRVNAEQRGASRGRTVKAKQEPDRRRLARAVRAQVSVDLTLLHHKVKLVERQRRAVALGQASGGDRCSGRHATTVRSASGAADRVRCGSASVISRGVGTP